MRTFYEGSEAFAPLIALRDSQRQFSLDLYGRLIRAEL